MNRFITRLLHDLNSRPVALNIKGVTNRHLMSLLTCHIDGSGFGFGFGMLSEPIVILLFFYFCNKELIR